MKIDPIWINSGFLFAVGVLLLVIVVMTFMLLEAKRQRGQLMSTIDAGTTRQKKRLQEHCSEIEAIEQGHLEEMAAKARELEQLRVLLSVAELGREIAEQQVELLIDQAARQDRAAVDVKSGLATAS